ncbi:hypothetical protein TRAPUB_3645, partial [Trametes pubescens]
MRTEAIARAAAAPKLPSLLEEDPSTEVAVDGASYNGSTIQTGGASVMGGHGMVTGEAETHQYANEEANCHEHAQGVHGPLNEDATRTATVGDGGLAKGAAAPSGTTDDAVATTKGTLGEARANTTAHAATTGGERAYVATENALGTATSADMGLPLGVLGTPGTALRGGT